MKNVKPPAQFENASSITLIDQTSLDPIRSGLSIPREVMEIPLNWQYIEVSSLDSGDNQKPELELLSSFFSSQPYQLPVWLLDALRDCIIIADQDGVIQCINRSAQVLTGWEHNPTEPVSIQQILHKDLFTQDSCQQYSLPEIGSEFENKYSTTSLQIGAQKILSIEYSAFILYQGTGTLLGFGLVFRTALESDSLLDRSLDTSLHDPLTGLFNRSHFDFLLNKTLVECKDTDQLHTLCYIDIDWFKIVNETCGISAGDMLISQLSQLLSKRVRNSDVLSRLGADQFAIILYGYKLEKALQVIDTIRQEIKNLKFTWDNKTIACTVSVGVVMLDSLSCDSSQVIGTASMACNIAKSNGRDRVYVSCDSDNRLDVQRHEYNLTFNIFNALENNDFVLFQQPIADLRSVEVDSQNPKIHSCEILLRLSHQGSLISPVKFIPLAEKYGLMHLLDRQVIRMCFAAISQSLDSPSTSSYEFCQPELVSINLSGSSLNDDSFYDFILEQFSLFNVLPKSICFEITESAAIKNLYSTKLLITRLRDLGCSFALDDFGIGMSSFEYLRNLPVNYLKIDGSFVKEINVNHVQCEIVESINRVAHVMGIKTIAEYVENVDILSKLSAIGVDYVQGYYIAKPMMLNKDYLRFALGRCD
jgi:diguanylate cyclase (GGDEF)-like protein